VPARNKLTFKMRNSQIEADLVDQLFNSSEKRLARLLIMLSQVGQEAELRTVVAPISQEVMAARVGTPRSRINYFINKLRKLGLIEYDGELKVHSSLLNVIIRE
jgi:CRP/FNR family cyclic AMP-dependent transcriptional regulator